LPNRFRFLVLSLLVPWLGCSELFPSSGPGPAPVPATITPTGCTAATSIHTAPGGYYVNGNTICTADGHAHLFHGVDRPSLEWSSTGENLSAADFALMASWKANVVRIALNQDFWIAASPLFDANYASLLDTTIAWAEAAGMDVILDLHWSAPGDLLATAALPMPDADHAPAFWSDVARTFRGNDAVVFDLFNEPGPDGNRDSVAAWECWRDGGTCAGVPYPVAGMSELLRVVRESGATNVVALAGVQWGNTLTRWLEYAPDDDAIVASWHTYDFAWCVTIACYEANVGALSDDVPVIGTEIGTNACAAAWMGELMDWLDHRRLGYLAWTWSTWLAQSCAASALILDYDGTPSPYGAIYREHLAALPKRLR